MPHLVGGVVGMTLSQAACADMGYACSCFDIIALAAG